MSQQTTAVELALLASAAFPRLDTTPLALLTTDLPANSGGYDLGGATRAQVTISLQKNAGKRRVVVEFTTVDLATTYTLALGDGGGAPSVTYDAAAGAPANEAALLTQWAAVINAPGSGLFAYVTAEIEDGALVVSHRGGGSPYRLSTPSASVALTMSVEADSCQVLIFSRSSAPVSISDDATATEARQRLSGWQLHFDGLQPWIVSIEDGNGYRGILQTAGLAAIIPIVGSVEIAAHDLLTVNGVSSVPETIPPWGAVCPCVVG